MLCFFVFYLPVVNENKEKKQLATQPMVPGSLETPSKRDMLADPNCLR